MAFSSGCPISHYALKGISQRQTTSGRRKSLRGGGRNESEHVARRLLCPNSLVSRGSVSPRFRRCNARVRCSQRQPWQMTATPPQLLGKLIILSYTLNLAKPGRRYVLLIRPDLQALILNPPLLCHEQALIRLARLSFEIVQL